MRAFETHQYPIQRRFVIAWALAVLLAGCSPKVEAGKPFTLPNDKSAAVFGASGVSESSMTNQDGKPVLGIVLRDASLIRGAQDLAACKRRYYVVFWDLFFGSCVRSTYWVQQSERRAQIGLPVMWTRLVPVSVVAVDSNIVVSKSTTLRVGYAELSVDTNDFSRSFVP